MKSYRSDEKTALIVKRQNVKSGNLDVPPGTYESRSFSSSFGRAEEIRVVEAIVNLTTIERVK